MPEVFYRQAEMVKGVRVQVAWIPEKFAKVGGYVKLKGDDGWRITYVSNARLSEHDRRQAGDSEVFASIQS